jgi:hypothetical protein
MLQSLMSLEGDPRPELIYFIIQKLSENCTHIIKGCLHTLEMLQRVHHTEQKVTQTLTFHCHFLNHEQCEGMHSPFLKVVYWNIQMKVWHTQDSNSAWQSTDNSIHQTVVCSYYLT